MSTSRQRKSAYHHGDLRNALVGAALHLVEKKGASQVSLREVARAARVSPAASYRHFSSREKLLAAVAARGFDALTEAHSRLLKNPDATPAHGMGRLYIDFALAHPHLFRLMFSPELRKDDFAELHAASQRSIGVLRGALQDAGIATVREASIGAWALVHGLSVLLIDQQISEDMTMPPARDRMIELVTGIYGLGLRQMQQQRTQATPAADEFGQGGVSP